MTERVCFVWFVFVLEIGITQVAKKWLVIITLIIESQLVVLGRRHKSLTNTQSTQCFCIAGQRESPTCLYVVPTQPHRN